MGVFHLLVCKRPHHILNVENNVYLYIHCFLSLYAQLQNHLNKLFVSMQNCVSMRLLWYFCKHSQLAGLLPLLENGLYFLTLLEKDMSLCASIQDNQVILVLVPPCISPPAPWPLSSVKSHLPSGLYGVFHSFIIYLQCPTDFSLLWHLTKNLMVRYFSPHIRLWSIQWTSLGAKKLGWIVGSLAPFFLPIEQTRLYVFRKNNNNMSPKYVKQSLKLWRYKSFLSKHLHLILFKVEK